MLLLTPLLQAALPPLTIRMDLGRVAIDERRIRATTLIDVRTDPRTGRRLAW